MPRSCAAFWLMTVSDMDRQLHEECGVFGVRLPEKGDVASLAYYALYSLQHRGQESAGIAVNDDGVIRAYRDVGLVGDVFRPEGKQRNGFDGDLKGTGSRRRSVHAGSYPGIRLQPGRIIP